MFGLVRLPLCLSFGLDSRPVSLARVSHHLLELGSIRKQLDTGIITTVDQFAEKVRLVWNNAMTFNPPVNDCHIMAKRLKEVFEKDFAAVINPAPRPSKKQRLSIGVGSAGGFFPAPPPSSQASYAARAASASSSSSPKPPPSSIPPAAAAAAPKPFPPCALFCFFLSVASPQCLHWFLVVVPNQASLSNNPHRASLSLLPLHLHL